MEQNNFEKNVQQKMDELKIAPSESVWTNVEKRIAKKDKDKKVIFILFFLIHQKITRGKINN
jgi:adenylate kinase family enzyme